MFPDRHQAQWRLYCTAEVAVRIVAVPPRVERQSSLLFRFLRPVPDALAVFIDFPNTVKRHAMAPALRV